jgi:hypothetical protein
VNPKRHVCWWIISTIGGSTPVRQCQAPATHWCSKSGSQYCDDHVGDYADVCGDDSLKEFPIEEAKP